MNAHAEQDEREQSFNAAKQTSENKISENKQMEEESVP